MSHIIWFRSRGLCAKKNGYLKRGTMENESNINQCSPVQGLQVDVPQLEKPDPQFYDDLQARIVFNFFCQEWRFEIV